MTMDSGAGAETPLCVNAPRLTLLRSPSHVWTPLKILAIGVWTVLVEKRVGRVQASAVEGTDVPGQVSSDAPEGSFW